MANKPLKTIKFPGLDDTYTVPQVDAALATSGAAADAKKTGDEISALKQEYNQLSADMETKANIDGSYDNMTVGNAKQLVATVGITDKTPYNFRTSGGSADIGDMEVDKVVGGTVAWNQLVRNGNFENTSNWDCLRCSISVSDNVATVTCTAEISQGNMVLSNHSSYSKSGHKYIATAEIYIPSTNETMVSVGFGIRGNLETYSNLDQWNKVTHVLNCSAANDIVAFANRTSSSVGDYFMAKNVMVIDITAMFGSTIADYIYGLEQSQAGAGVAWFKKLFPKPYYAYNAGSLLSVQTSEHKMVGFNAWNEQWEVGTYSNTDGTKSIDYSRLRCKDKIPCVPNTAYFYSCNTGTYTGNLTILFYDADENFISYYNFNPDHLFTTPDNCHYMTFYTGTAYGTTYNHDICINLSWDGERDGEYEPYVEYTYPLDDSLTLRGIPKLDSGNNLYYDGDVYEADGTVQRRYGIVDLGTMTWASSSSGNVGYFYSTSINTLAKKGSFAEGYTHIRCSLYVAQNVASLNSLADKSMSIDSGGNIQIHDSAYSDSNAFKTAMSGVYLIYELATPTTESADPFINPQIVDDFGTEEYVDAGVTASTPTRDVAIPVGHETIYQANLRAKLEMSPDSPGDGDGDYIVRQTGGVNEYVLLEKELPTAPSTDGTYHLEVTINDGEPTLAWVANE